MSAVLRRERPVFIEINLYLNRGSKLLPLFLFPYFFSRLKPPQSVAETLYIKNSRAPFVKLRKVQFIINTDINYHLLVKKLIKEQLRQ